MNYNTFVMTNSENINHNNSNNGNGYHEEVTTKELPKFIGIIHSDAKREYFPTEEQFISEASAEEDAKITGSYLEKLGVKIKLYPGNSDLPKSLEDDKPEMLFNLVDSVRGREDLASTIPALLELMGVPFSGSGMFGLSINYNKYFTKKLLEVVGLPVPRYQLFSTPTDAIDSQLKYPLIVKLNEIHGSVGIDYTSVVEDEKSLRTKMKELMALYKQPIIAEEFIVGREITCILLEGTNKKVYSAEKILPENPNSKYKLASFSYQWIDKNPAKYVKHEGGDLLRGYIKDAFEILKLDGFAKFDLRLDESGRYYFIDCNANPAFGPVELGIATSSICELYGIPFEEILRRIIENARKDKRKPIILESANV